jgi:hypothetical protein
MNSGFDSSDASSDAHPPVQVKNRRKRYLDLHPEYFSADLELAGPLALSLLPAPTWTMAPVLRDGSRKQNPKLTDVELLF